MKKNIHPVKKEVTINCNCGNKFSLFLVLDNSQMNVEVCYQCHPFFTGKQKIIDVSGRVDNFYKKFSKLRN